MSEYGRFEHSNNVTNKRIVLRDLKDNVYKVIWKVNNQATPEHKKYTDPRLEKLNKSSFKKLCNDFIIIDIPDDLTKQANIKSITSALHNISYYFNPIDEKREFVEGSIPVYTSKYYYKDKPAVIINCLDGYFSHAYLFVRKNLAFEIKHNVMNKCNKHFIRQLNFIDCKFNISHSNAKSKIIYSGNFAYKNNDYITRTNLSTTFVNIHVNLGAINCRNEFENVYGLFIDSSITNAKLSNFFAWINQLNITESEISYIPDDDLIGSDDHIPTIRLTVNNGKNYINHLVLEHSKLFISNEFRYSEEDIERNKMLCDAECGSIFINIKEPLLLNNQYVTLDLNMAPYTTKNIGIGAVNKITKVGHVKI